MRIKGYRFLNNYKKIAKIDDFREQKKGQRLKNHVYKQKILKTMDKMMSWGMAAPFLMMPVTLQGIKNT
jgi:hypothetical protein